MKELVTQLPPLRDSLCSCPLSVSHMAEVNNLGYTGFLWCSGEMSVARHRNISGTEAELSFDRAEKQFSGGCWYLALPGQRDLWD